MSSPKGSRQERRAGLPNCAGSVAAEFALVAPVVILIAVGIADFEHARGQICRIGGNDAYRR